MAFDLKTYMQERRQQVESYLTQHFHGYADSPKLAEAMTYSLEAGGKRVRPILTLAAFEAAGGKNLSQVLPVAAALECIHTYSLIHDDLPAMDDDDLRRGKPTNHKVFGEATAILAGDGLLTEAFTLLSLPNSSLPAALQVALIKRIADAAGARGMVGGQQFDMDHESKTPNIDTLKRIHTYKTGRLLTVAVEAGAMAAGRGLQELKAFSDYGYHLGYAFQIYDDVLDVIGGEEIGKTQKSDLKHAKATFVALLGVDESVRLARAEIDAAIAAVTPFGAAAEPLIELARYIVNRKS